MIIIVRILAARGLNVSLHDGKRVWWNDNHRLKWFEMIEINFVSMIHAYFRADKPKELKRIYHR